FGIGALGLRLSFPRSPCEELPSSLPEEGDLRPFVLVSCTSILLVRSFVLSHVPSQSPTLADGGPMLSCKIVLSNRRNSRLEADFDDSTSNPGAPDFHGWNGLETGSEWNFRAYDQGF